MKETEKNTKVKWYVEELLHGESYSIFSDTDNYELARVFIHNGEQEGNAELICALVNAAQEINPDNPMAVANNLKAMRDIVVAILTESVKGHEHMMDFQQARRMHITIGTLQKAKAVLASIEGKE